MARGWLVDHREGVAYVVIFRLSPPCRKRSISDCRCPPDSEVMTSLVGHDPGVRFGDLVWPLSLPPFPSFLPSLRIVATWYSYSRMQHCRYATLLGQLPWHVLMPPRIRCIVASGGSFMVSVEVLWPGGGDRRPRNGILGRLYVHLLDALTSPWRCCTDEVRAPWRNDGGYAVFIEDVRRSKWHRAGGRHVDAPPGHSWSRWSFLNAALVVHVTSLVEWRP